MLVSWVKHITLPLYGLLEVSISLNFSANCNMDSNIWSSADSNVFLFSSFNLNQASLDLTLIQCCSRVWLLFLQMLLYRGSLLNPRKLQLFHCNIQYWSDILLSEIIWIEYCMVQFGKLTKRAIFDLIYCN